MSEIDQYPDWSAEAHEHICGLVEKIEALEAEVARLKEWQDAFIAAKDGTDTALVSAEAKLRAVGDALTDHMADLRRTAKVLADWQDPNAGPLDATIRELHKAADELEALLKEVRYE